MDLGHLRARAAIVVVLAAGATFLLLRIARSREWQAGAWRDPPAANVIASGAVGVAGILCGVLLFARPGALSRMLCVTWAVIVAILGIALAARGDDSATIIVVLAAGVGAAVVPWGPGRAGRVGAAKRR
jgi:hypothetical protein